MLTEEMRIISGLQEAKVVENLLPKFIEEENNKMLIEKQRIINEKKTVLNSFPEFNRKIYELSEMLRVINTIFEDKKTTTLFNGLYESRYNTISKFAEIVINDDFSIAINYLYENFDNIKKEIDKIETISESIDESKAITFFVATDLVDSDESLTVSIRMYEDKILEHEISDRISYGAEIIYISENKSIIVENGQRFYSSFSLNDLKLLERKGFLI